MNASHQSLRDDYEVTGDELDALVEAAWDTEVGRIADLLSVNSTNVFYKIVDSFCADEADGASTETCACHTGA